MAKRKEKRLLSNLEMTIILCIISGVFKERYDMGFSELVDAWFVSQIMYNDWHQNNVVLGR